MGRNVGTRTEFRYKQSVTSGTDERSSSLIKELAVLGTTGFKKVSAATTANAHKSSAGWEGFRVLRRLCLLLKLLTLGSADMTSLVGEENFETDSL